MSYRLPSLFIFLPCAAVLWYGSSINASVFYHPEESIARKAPTLETKQVIVKWRNAQIASKFSRYRAEFVQPGLPLQFVRNLSNGFQVLRVAPGQKVEDVVQVLSRNQWVESIVPDRLFQIAATPNDPRYNEQWDLFEAAGGLNLPEAWDITAGSEEVVVAVVDTGVLPHADLRGQILPGYDFISDPFIANDGDGRDDDPTDPGDWIEPFDCDPFQWVGMDSSWHGTHISGTVAAKANNDMGVAGIASNVKILPVRVLGKCGGQWSDVIDGMRWAAGLKVEGVPINPYPAKVLNFSLGATASCEKVMQDAVTEIIEKGVVLVVAAGNQEGNITDYTPANCDGVIGVAANNREGGLAFYSNFGDKVTVTAPGGELMAIDDKDGILSTLNEGKTSAAADSYAFYQGTSMAAPHVSGVVALIMSIAPTTTPNQVIQILKRTVKAFPTEAKNACDITRCGAGIVDAGAAVKAASQLADQ